MVVKVKRGELVYDCPLCGTELDDPVVCDTEYGEQVELYCPACLNAFKKAVAMDDAIANSRSNI